MGVAETIGANIRAARTTTAMSQEDLAARLGLSSHSAVSDMEAGRRRVSAVELVKLAELFGRSVDWFLDPKAAREDFVALARAQDRDESLKRALLEAQTLVENFLFLRELLKRDAA